MITSFKLRLLPSVSKPRSRAAILIVIAAGCCTLFGRNLSSQGGAAPGVERSVEQEKPDKRSPRVVSGASVTLNIKDSSLRYVLQEISRQTNHPIVFDYTDSFASKRVSVNIVNKNVGEAINLALKGTGLISVVAPDAETIVIRRQAAKRDTVESKRTTLNVVGHVIDSATKKALVEATVTILNTNFSTLTETDGSFRLQNVPTGSHVLSVRLIGYKSRQQALELSPGKIANLLVRLSASTATLAEVVTTVTGTQRKIEIGNDITTLNVEEIMKQAPITSVTDLLEARVPGLTVMRTSGVPGAPSRIRLRGIGGGLLAGVPGAPTNDPIVVVDGIRIQSSQSGVDDQKIGGGVYPTPSPIDQIDPNTIEKIEVLRGPSAAAMYGSDAGDGVIVITTKQGRAGPMHWGMTGVSGIEYMPGFYAQPGFYRFGHATNGGSLGSSNNSRTNPFCPGLGSPNASTDSYFGCIVDSLVRFQALNESRLSTIGRGSRYSLSATASGGTQLLTYSVTGSISNSLGLTKMPSLYQDLFTQLYDSAPNKRMRRPNTMDQKSGQARFSGELSEGVRATFTTSILQSLQHQSSANAELASLASVYIDTMNIQPAEIGNYAYQLNTRFLTSNNALTLDFVKWTSFPLTATFGASREERVGEGVTPRGIITYKYSFGDEVTTSQGKFTERRENRTTVTSRMNGTFFPRARISTTVGAEITRRLNEAMEGFSDTLVPGVSRPTQLIGGTRSGRNTTTGGWFFEPRLNLNSRFFVNPGFRFDASSVSGSKGGFRGGILSLFPKMNFSWIAVDREGGKPLWGVVSLVRPRFAFGVAGVQPAAEWSLRLLEQDVGTWTEGNGDPNLVAPDLGLRLRSVGNTRLGPEKTREVEGGVDMQLWDTRLTFGITGFYKIRKDAIERLPLAPSVGTTMSYYTNIGHVRNTGGEMTLSAIILDLPAVNWNVDLSVSKYVNKLVKLYGERDYVDLGNGTRLVEGYPLFGRWSRPITGWTNPIDGLKLRYKDIVVADSSVYMGMQAPDFEMPFRSSLTLFHGLLSLNSQFNYKAGLTQNNLGSRGLLGNIYENPSSSLGQQAAALAAACFQSGSVDYYNNIGKPCTDYGFIQKVNSLRFNSVSIGYNVPRGYLKRYPISTLSLSLQGSNLGLWTNYRGKDPDVNSNLVGDVTSDEGQLPMPRTWSLQVRIGT